MKSSNRTSHELLAGLGELEQTFLAGDRAFDGEAAVVDGYRMLTTCLGVGLDTYLYAEPSRPVFMNAGCGAASVAREQLDHPNAISTHDQPRGSLAFRWFLAEAVPFRPDVRLVEVGDAPTMLG